VSVHPIVFVALMVVGISARSASAQNGGALEGVVVDSATGRPLVGAKVAVWPGRSGRERTDSLGRYRLDRIGFPETVLELNCPSRTLLGKGLLTQRLRVPLGRTTRRDWRVDATLCDEPEPFERRGELAGRWLAGFEESSFTPCVDSVFTKFPLHLFEEGLAPVSAWATLGDDVIPRGTRWPEPMVRIGNYPAYFVRWTGVFRGPGTYGHMGASSYEFVVERLGELRPWGYFGEGRACPRR
jgi:hypothetical protein